MSHFRTFQILFFITGLLSSQASMAGNFVMNKVTGFADLTAATPVGGNTGNTIGAQRSQLVDYAASQWSAMLQPAVNIKIDVKFDATLFCDGDEVIFAQTTSNFERDLSGLPYSATWYHKALSENLRLTTASNATTMTIVINNKLTGSSGCFNNARWYYGFDHNVGANEYDLLQIVMHEITHGLGFSSAVNFSTGERLIGTAPCASGCDDIYMKFLRDHSANKLWPSMSNAERSASAIDTGDLLWTGTNVQHVKPILTGGFKSGTNYPLLYAPSPLASGSSVNHWNTNVAYTGGKHELMEPSPQSPFDMAVTIALMRDLGWNNATYDFDNDGVADHLDAFPHKNAAGADTDGDGKPDVWLGGSGCSGNTCSTLTLDWDDDNDGVPDSVDAAPLDAGNRSENTLPLNQAYKGLRYSSSSQAQ